MATLVYTFTEHTKDINCCSFATNSKYLASVSGDKTIRLWDITDGTQLDYSPLTAHTYSVTSCAFSPFGSILATGSQDLTIILWDVENGEQIKILLGHKSIIRSLTFSHNSHYLASASSDETVCIWDVKLFTLLHTLTGPDVSITTCRFTPDDLYMVSGSVYGDIRIWELTTGKCESMVQAHDAGLSGVGITGCDFSPTYGAANQLCSTDGGESPCFLLATCGGDNLLKLWFVYTASAYSGSCNFQFKAALEGHGGHVWQCKFSSDGKILVSCSSDKTVIFWDPLTGKIYSKISAHSRYITTLCLSPDGKYMATGSNDKTVKVWKIDEVYSGSPQTRSEQQYITYADSLEKKKLIRTWSTEDVISWLKTLGLDQYGNIFRENMIDGIELLQITDDMLCNGLGIGPLGHRNKIMRELAAAKKVEIEGNIPDEFLCPISRELMIDPVVLADGFTYERSSITKWLDSGKNTSPMTNAPLLHANLIPNRPLKSAISRYFGPEPLSLCI